LKLKVKTRRDSDGRLTYLWLKKKRQTKPVVLDFEYGNDGFLKAIEFEGRETDLPPISDLVELLNEKFMERLGTIGTIELIDKIQLIDWIAPEVIDTVTYNTVIGAIKLVKLIKNIESIDLIDKITEITEIKDIKTLGGINLVIDKLTQNAYTERRSTLSNSSGAITFLADNLTNKRGKFFPRGCRGFINTIEVYCDNQQAASRTVTVHVSPHPSMGETFSKEYTYAGLWAAQYIAFTIKKMWNYDSMFVWFTSDSDTYGRIGYDAGTPPDALTSDDLITWTPESKRYLIKVNLTGETVGDLPVSGTLNTVNLPSLASHYSSAATDIGAGASETLATIYGAGKLVYASFKSNYSNVTLRVKPDATTMNFNIAEAIAWGYAASTPAFQLLKNVASDYRIAVTVPIPFRRKLVLEGVNLEAVEVQVKLGDTIAHLIS